MKKGNVPLDSFCGNASVVESATHDSTEGESCVEADLGIDFLHSVSELRKLLDRLALSHENEDYLASLQSDMRTIALSCSPAQAHFKLAEHLKLCIREKNGCVINRKLPAPQITFDLKDFSNFPALSFGRYRENFTEIKSVGSGGFGKVFLVTHKLDGHTYCIKMIRIAGQVDADRTRMIKKIGRAMREARCLSLLSHPNVIRYYSSWMEYTSPEALDSPKPVEFATPKTPEAPHHFQNFEAMEFIGETTSPLNFEFTANHSKTYIQPSRSFSAHYLSESCSGSNDADFNSEHADEDDCSEEDGLLGEHVSMHLNHTDSPADRFDITLYLQMEACQIDLTLAHLLDLMRQGHHVPFADRIQSMCELAAALQHTHLSGIVHRDVKPGNVFFQFPCTIKLADFGLSKESANDPVMYEIQKSCHTRGGSLHEDPIFGRNGPASTAPDQELTSSCGTIS